MEQRKPKRLEPEQAFSEQLLATYYSQFLKWGAVLTRGDVGKAQDLVQEFCLYFALTKPDLSNVSNLEGYLYTCLRHIYLSGLSRASREALRFVSIADFDSFDFAIAANQSGDPLQRQNDLRRICSYAVWRKEQSKSASYFILHFFHGYSRREIAEISRLPLSAIYNKLKAARTEVKSHLSESGRLRIIGHDSPPIPSRSWSLSSPADLFTELRGMILNARTGGCMTEEDLIVHYCSSTRVPIPCSLLAHIVSCERCLDIIDRHFNRPTLKDREPLDSLDSSSRSESVSEPGASNEIAMLRLYQKRWGRIHEHRPNTLSIAVNGKIIASHDVQSQHSTLSARIETIEKALFVEVFSEQDVRLALVSVGEMPPNGPPTMRQRVRLSDSRWLELNLTFDGLGLNSQVDYCDPALATSALELEGDEVVSETISSVPLTISDGRSTPSESWGSAIVNRFLSSFTPASALAWALTLAVVVGASSYLVYRNEKPQVGMEVILNESIRVETVNLQGQTEHQVINVEEVSTNGRTLQRGVVDLLKDGDGRRYLRRLYDPHHQLIAAKWRNKNGEHSSYPHGSDRGSADTHHPRSINGLWDQDLSASAFQSLCGKESHIVPVKGGYELTTVGPVVGHPQLISATLMLDTSLSPIRQTMRFRAGSEIHELRFVQANYERLPSSSVSDAVFDQEYAEPFTDRGLHSMLQQESVETDNIRDGRKLAQLQISVLYQLNSLGADIGEPIEVVRTAEGHIRVSGAIEDNPLRQEVITHLEALEDHQLLDLKLLSPQDAQSQISRMHPGVSEETSVYDVGSALPLADGVLRNYLQAKGLSGGALDSSVAEQSHAAVLHAQRALQNAYALNRLGSALSSTELSSIGVTSQQQWTEMVHKHATELEGQLRVLSGQLAEIHPSVAGETSPVEQVIVIGNSADFSSAASRILQQTQNLNRNVGALFTSSPLIGSSPAESLLGESLNVIPLLQAEEIARFASRLRASGGSAQTTIQQRNREGSHKQPR